MLIGSVGMVFIIEYGSILKTPREYLKGAASFLNELLSCSQCLGFWCGLIIQGIFQCLTGTELLYSVFITLVWACAVSLLAPCIDMAMDILGAYQEKMLDETKEIHEENHKNSV